MAESIFIQGLRVEFISSKKDNYDNMISYFKERDSFSKEKLKIVRNCQILFISRFGKQIRKRLC